MTMLFSCKKMSTFPKIQVSPDPSLFDEPVQITLEGTCVIEIIRIETAEESGL